VDKRKEIRHDVRVTPVTTPSSPPRRGRPPKGSRQLSKEAIVEATLKVVDAVGPEGVSMRAVASVLGVDAKSLYNHVQGKEGLLDDVAEHLLGAIVIPARTDSWEDDLRAIADAFRAAMITHPRAAELVLTRQLTSVAGLAPVEALLAVLHNAGFDAHESVNLLRSLVATLIGTLLREVNAGPTFGSSDPDEIQRRRSALTDAGMPAIAFSAEHLAHFDAESEFAYAVDLGISAIRARLPE
jgi:AcrR family transcriptional regulator